MASILVLGTSHRFQGTPSFIGSINDPDYAETIRTIISERSIDFVFEEASGCGPSTAQKLVEPTEAVRYLDVDPHLSVRHEHGIVDDSGQPFPFGITPEKLIEEQEKREQLWCTQIAAQKFERGLLICGYMHVLSMCFRLSSAD